MSTITGILGLQGSGKTMVMTYFAKRESKKGRTIYSNYSLKGIDYIPVSTLSDIEKMRNGVFLGDELWLWVFSRTSQSKLNKEINKIIMLNRKRDMDIYYTAQRFKSVDVMLRSVTNYFVKPFLKKVNNIWRIGYTIYNEIGLELVTYLLKNNLEYYGQFYDTTEEIGLLKDKTDKQNYGDFGKIRENNFNIAIKKLLHTSIIPIPNSGNKQDLPFDFIVIDKKNKIHYLIDVKGTTENQYRVINANKNIENKIQIAEDNYFIPCWVFPKNKDEKKPKNWYISILNSNKNKDYLKSIKGYPVINKLIKKNLDCFFV